MAGKLQRAKRGMNVDWEILINFMMTVGKIELEMVDFCYSQWKPCSLKTLHNFIECWWKKNLISNVQWIIKNASIWIFFLNLVWYLTSESTYCTTNQTNPRSNLITCLADKSQFRSIFPEKNSINLPNSGNSTSFSNLRPLHCLICYLPLSTFFRSKFKFLCASHLRMWNILFIKWLSSTVSWKRACKIFIIVKI